MNKISSLKATSLCFVIYVYIIIYNFQQLSESTFLKCNNVSLRICCESKSSKIYLWCGDIKLAKNCNNVCELLRMDFLVSILFWSYFYHVRNTQQREVLYLRTRFHNRTDILAIIFYTNCKLDKQKKYNKIIEKEKTNLEYFILSNFKKKKVI